MASANDSRKRSTGSTPKAEQAQAACRVELDELRYIDLAARLDGKRSRDEWIRDVIVPRARAVCASHGVSPLPSLRPVVTGQAA